LDVISVQAGMTLCCEALPLAASQNEENLLQNFTFS